MFMKMNAAALVTGFLLAGTANAGAAAAFYTDFDSWNAVVPGFSYLEIPDPGPAGFEHFGKGTASVSYGGVLFATNAALGNGDFFNIGPAFGASLPILSSQDQDQGVANISITLAAPVKAFALNFDTFVVQDQFYGYDVTFTLSNGETLTLGTAGDAYNPGSFFGVTDDTPFQTILLTSLSPALNINGLKLGEAVAAVPEPATWVMLVLGFLGVGVFGARRSVRRVAAA
jgi:hypothetical protein